MTRSPAEAVAWAKRYSSWKPSGMCQQFSRSAFGVGSYYGSAALAWKHAKHKHWTTDPRSIPTGVPVFWTGGSHGYGHVAISLGNGLVRSTDWPRRYQVSTARIEDISRAWGLRLVGWTEDINTVRVYQPPTLKHPSTDPEKEYDMTPDQIATAPVVMLSGDKNTPRKVTLQEVLRDLEGTQDKHGAQLDRIEKLLKAAIEGKD